MKIIIPQVGVKTIPWRILNRGISTEGGEEGGIYWMKLCTAFRPETDYYQLIKIWLDSSKWDLRETLLTKKKFVPIVSNSFL